MVPGTAVPSYASIIWIRFMGLVRSRAALSAFVPASASTGWLPGDNCNFRTPKPAGQGCLRTATIADAHHGNGFRSAVGFC